MTVVVRAPTAINLELHTRSKIIKAKDSSLYQKSLGVPSRQTGHMTAVRMTIQAQLERLTWNDWKMFWKKEPRRTMTTQETPSKVMEIQTETMCLTVGPAAFSAMTM